KVVTYSLDADAMLGAANIAKLQAAMRELEQRDAPHQTFRPGAGALNGGGSGGAVLLERSRAFTYDQRIAVMREARVRIDVRGLANLALARHPDIVEMLRARSGQGVEIRILQCGHSNPGLASLAGARDGAAVDAVRKEIDTAAEAWKRIAETPEID